MISSLRRIWWVLLISILSFAAARLIYHYRVSHPTLSEIARSIQNHLYEGEEQLEETLQDTSLLQAIVRDDLSEKVLRDLSDLPFILLAYQGDSLLFWSGNKALPSSNVLHGTRFDRVVRLRNGYYEIVRTPESVKLPEHIKVFGLMPLKYEYPIENAYLKSRFAFDVLAPENAAFSLKPIKGGKEIRNEQGKALFYIYWKGQRDAPRPGWPEGVLIGIALLSLFVFINEWAQYFRRIFHPLAVFTLLAVVILGLREAMLVSGWPAMLYHTRLFDPVHYASSALSPSLGDFTLNVLVIAWLAVFFFRMLKNGRLELEKKWLPLAMALGYFLVFTGLLVCSRSVQNLVIDSSISFDINNFLTLDIYSFVGLLDTGLLLLALFVFSYRVISLLESAGPSAKHRLMALALAMLGFLPLGMYSGTGLHPVLFYISGIAFVFLLTWFVIGRAALRSFSGLIVWLLYFSVFASWLFHRFNHERDVEKRKLFITRLEQQRDPLFEFHFYDIRKPLQEDVLVAGFFKNPFISRKPLVDRINYLYFREWLSKYSIRIHTYSTDSMRYKDPMAPTLTKLEAARDSISFTSFYNDLYYMSPYPGNYYYESILPIHKKGSDDTLGFLALQFFPNQVTYSNVYPELLLEQKVRSSGEYEGYSYAVYSRGLLVHRKGNYSYRQRYSGGEPGLYYQFTENDFEHLVHVITKGESLWVSVPVIGPFSIISLSSYFFCFFLLFIVLSWVAIALYRTSLHGEPLPFRWPATFRARIQSVIILIIVLTFVIIGVITVWNTGLQYDQYHHERLNRKVKQVLAGLEYFRSTEGMADWFDFLKEPNKLTNEIGILSNIHSMDVNIYTADGRLVASSQPAIFDKGLINRLIDPVAFYHIRTMYETQFVNQEQIGDLKYLSAYIPLTGQQGKLQAILNVPYFAKERNLRNEISDFLVYFINLYVLLLVLAGMVAVFISNSVTRSLKVIADKLQKVRLGQPNEPIEWPGKDEIGQLVKEYNKMIRELEISAEKLARSERESAWREMAKQVAHEIKNPLTPMKLSIQHLQRAWLNQDPNLGQLIRKTTNTLIDQIENLSNIASEFSNFAQMPQTVHKPVDLTELLRSISILYQNESAEFQMEIPGEKLMIMADKGQVLRVFNNLMKNALQAIPDDREGLIRVNCHVKEDKVLISVADNGKGIPPEEAGKVFSPNFTTKGSGMGLGLTISKQVVESFGGKIWFESDPPHGTVFYVEYPLLRPDASAGEKS